jgi:hypothetical protein
MAFLQNFSVAQTPANPKYLILTDTSTGSDEFIVSRKIYIQDCFGNYIVPAGYGINYIEWALENNPISIDLLTKDVAVNILVQWLDVNGAVLYELNNNYCLPEFNKQFLYYLVQLQSNNYNIIQDTRYWDNVATFWTNIVGAMNAVQNGNDIFASQESLDRASYMAENQFKFF